MEKLHVSINSKVSVFSSRFIFNLYELFEVRGNQSKANILTFPSYKNDEKFKALTKTTPIQ